MIEGKDEAHRHWLCRYDYRDGHVIPKEEHEFTAKQAPKQLASILETRETCSQCWKINREAAQQLQQKIRAYSQEAPILSSILWCHTMLRSTNIFHISGDLPYGIDSIAELRQKTPFTNRIYAKLREATHEKTITNSWW